MIGEKLIVARQILDDWEQWNEKEANDQWQALGNVWYILESGSQRPAPEAAEEGSGDEALGIEDF